MVTYVLRRLVTAVFILFGASFLVYLLTAASGDPLASLEEGADPNKEVLIQNRIQLLDLNVPAPIRYFIWLGGAAKCVVPGLQCDLGMTITGQPVTEAVVRAMGSTIQLVTVATILSIVIGVTLGIVTALRQYSGLDYLVTFMSFLFFSLPVFWVAVLLKEYAAIGFNDFLADPQIPPATFGLVAIMFAILGYLTARGSLKRRLLFALGTGLVTVAVLLYLQLTNFFETPSLGLVIIGLTGIAVAVGLTVIFSNLSDRRVLIAGLAMVLFGLVIYFPIQPLFARATVLMLVLLAIAMVLVGIAAAWIAGGNDRNVTVKVTVPTALAVYGLIVLDRFMQSWPAYVSDGRIRGRPIATIGAETPNLQGDLWIIGIDKFTHLLLPTIALILISIASYSRYSRASMLEIMNMDYIRTARAKGLPERTVVVRHAFRNALIPLATLVAFDIGGLIGGAVITENVFAFSGMGALFITGLRDVDPNPVMAFFLVTAVLALVFNLIADIAYSLLDPRVRVK